MKVWLPSSLVSSWHAPTDALSLQYYDYYRSSGTLCQLFLFCQMCFSLKLIKLSCLFVFPCYCQILQCQVLPQWHTFLFDIFLHLSHWVSFIFISLGSLARCFSVDWLAFGILQSWWAFLSAPAWKGPLNLSYIWSVGSELYVLPWCSPCVGVHVLQLLLERKHTELSHSFTHKFHWALIKNSTKKKICFKGWALF